MSNSSTKPLWQNLRSLAELDQKQKKISIEIITIKEKIEEDNKILPQHIDAISQVKQSSIDAKKNVDLQELNAEHLKTQEETKRKALDKITKPKEYDAIESELKNLAQQVQEQDDALFKAWHDLDIVKQNYDASLSKCEESLELIKNEISQKEASIKELEKKAVEFEEQKKEFIALIPADWLARYEQMCSKVSDPIVPALNQSCSSCYYRVPQQDMSRLKRKALLPCRSCYRLLYHDQEEEQDIKSESF